MKHFLQKLLIPLVSLIKLTSVDSFTLMGQLKVKMLTIFLLRESNKDDCP
jgi:hypothetical protein